MEKRKKEIAIVYMVAGLSSRFGGKIKQFAKIGPEGESLIEYSINQAIKSGFNKIVFIVNEQTEKSFKNMFGFNYKGIPVLYCFQSFDLNFRDKPWGTADALACLKGIVNCPFVICNGDDIYGETSFKQLANHLLKNKNNATIGYRLGDVLLENACENRGIFKLDKKQNVQNIKEEFGISRENLNDFNLSLDNLCSMNIFAFQPNIIDFFCGAVDKFKLDHKEDRKTECLLPEVVSEIIKEKNIIIKIYPAKERHYGVTKPEDEGRVRTALSR